MGKKINGRQSLIYLVSDQKVTETKPGKWYPYSMKAFKAIGTYRLKRRVSVEIHLRSNFLRHICEEHSVKCKFYFANIFKFFPKIFRKTESVY